MKSDIRARQLLEKVYPGMIAALQSLGSGTFIEDHPAFILKGKKTETSVTNFNATVRYGFDDGMMVRISDSLVYSDEGWSSYHHAYHCGPDHRNEKDFYFRIDLDEIHHAHVHLKGSYVNGKDPHIPISMIDPSVKNIEPFEFLRLVDQFRRTRILPLKMKKDKL